MLIAFIGIRHWITIFDNSETAEQGPKQQEARFIQQTDEIISQNGRWKRYLDSQLPYNEFCSVFKLLTTCCAYSNHTGVFIFQLKSHCIPTIPAKEETIMY
jgi:hypothetical protein